jgi:hypothetical protein
MDGRSPDVVVTWAAYQQGQANDRKGHLLYPNGAPFFIRPVLAHEFWVVETHAPPQNGIAWGDYQVVLEAHTGQVLFCGGHTEGPR